ncbi:MAG: hypothetical protein NWQ46_07625, partial [Spirosomaceae bacterium]|nr:hypothetical protein [Spirosomataceae bacterium]
TPSLLQNLKNGSYNLDIYFQSNGSDCVENELKSAIYSTTFTYSKVLPVITFQPLDLVNCIGQDMFFKTDATADGLLNYQWERSDDGGTFEPFPFTSATHIQNGDTKVLKIDNSKSGDHEDTFRCKISYGNGCSVITEAASASINRIGSFITTENEFCEGDKTEFTARITYGDTLSFQWQYQPSSGSYTDLSDDNVFSGTKNGVLKVNGISTIYDKYRVQGIFKTIEMDDNGNSVLDYCTLSSSPKTFTITPRPAKPTLPDIVRCGSGIIDIVAPLEAAGYRWYTDTTQAAVSTDKTYSPNLTATQKLYFGYLSAESCESFRTEFTATVNPALVISQQPQNASECEGNSVTFTVSATGEGTLNYQWKKNGVDVGLNSNTLTISNLQSSDNNAQITCVITSNECDGITSTGATLSVIPPPNAPAVTSPAGFCNDE